ncbi:MAG: hypothetical protein WCJ07_05630 [Verrucomicrobiota bacterium]
MTPEIVLVITKGTLVITAEVLVTTNEALVITAGILVTTKIILGVIRTMFWTINANKTVISSKNTH